MNLASWGCRFSRPRMEITTETLVTVGSKVILLWSPLWEDFKLLDNSFYRRFDICTEFDQEVWKLDPSQHQWNNYLRTFPVYQRRISVENIKPPTFEYFVWESSSKSFRKLVCSQHWWRKETEEAETFEKGNLLSRQVPASCSLCGGIHVRKQLPLWWNGLWKV